MSELLNFVVCFAEINLQPEDMDNSSNDVPKLEAEIIRLPENLPNEILILIENIKTEAVKPTEGKTKTFSSAVNSNILK